ncbi:AcrID1 family anti-CRISPR protein [Microbacterium sediminicola]
MEFEELKSIIDKFFQDSTIIRINLRFNREVIASNDQFEEIVKDADLLHRYDDRNIRTDICEYRKNINSIINYYVKDSKVYIVEIDFWRSS